MISIVLVLAGLTIFAYVATILVEGIAGGVLTGALAERRRRRTIERLSEHYIICGYGRVGRRVGGGVPHAGVPFVVLDFNPSAIEFAREHGELFIEGTRHRGRGPAARPGSSGRAAWSPRRTPTRTTSTSRSPRDRCGPTC